VFLDACFSGAGRNGELEEARAGVRRTPNNVSVTSNNILIFAAASADQVSKPYNDKKHGIFSYYLFQTLQETKGKLSYAELVDIVIEKVQTKSILLNGEKQSPKVNVSKSASTIWQDWKVVE
jgi:methyltransferase-like protein